MAGITASEAADRLQDYLNAEETVLSGQSYSIGIRSFTRANLKEIREGIDYWDNKVQELSDGNTGFIISQQSPKDDR
jgi:hypothetical protein